MGYTCPYALEVNMTFWNCQCCSSELKIANQTCLVLNLWYLLVIISAYILKHSLMAPWAKDCNKRDHGSLCSLFSYVTYSDTVLPVPRVSIFFCYKARKATPLPFDTSQMAVNKVLLDHKTSLGYQDLE